ncbi:MAG: peptide chain release factor 1 [Myxococcota bacterium]
MFDRLQGVEAKFERLTAQLADPSVAGNAARFREVSREHAELEPVVSAYRAYRQAQAELEEARGLLRDDDPEMRAVAKEEVARLDQQLELLTLSLRKLLLPKDPNDAKNILVEIRAGTGGEEAALFAADLFRMYARFVERQGWKLDILSQSFAEAGGIKEVIALIEGKNVYSRLKYEAGVHRVQRVPATEAQGRIHTSAVTVAVLPEAEDVEVHVDERELHIDVFRSSGPGGQSVNTTDSAVRVTHLPSGLVVVCQDEKSQLKNKAKALKVLKARLLEREQQKAAAEVAQSRKAMVGTGDRSERIRTYNFPQGRITDHRIGLTLYQLDAFIQGEIGEVLDALAAHFEAELLKAQEEL